MGNHELLVLGSDDYWIIGTISLSGEWANQDFLELEMIIMQDLPETYLDFLFCAGLFIHLFLIFLAISFRGAAKEIQFN